MPYLSKLKTPYQFRQKRESVSVDRYERARNVRYDMIRELVIEHRRIDILAQYVLKGPKEDDPTWFHLEMMSWQDQNPEGLILAFRGARKTSYLTIARSILEIVCNPDIRILLVSDALDQAKSFLRAIKSQIEHNDEFKSIFGNYYLGSEKWTDSEIIVTKRTAVGLKEATITCAGMETAMLGRHFDIIIGDDLVTNDNSLTEGLREKTKNFFYRTLLHTLEPSGKIWILGCLTADTRVLCADGSWKFIVDIRPGMSVKSFDEENKKIVNKKVEAMIPQGIADVLEIKTNRHKIKATINHPFLVSRTGGLDSGLHWKRADELVVGDKVLSLGSIASGRICKTLGNAVTEEFGWMLGFLLGDGWVIANRTKNHDKKRNKDYLVIKYAVCCALKKDQSKNDKLSAAFFNWCGEHFYITKFGYIRADKSIPAKELLRLGFISGAKNKRIPEWVFCLPLNIRRAVLQGLCDSDGSKNKIGRAWRLELSNFKLIDDIYLLALMSGVRPSKIYVRTRNIKAPHSKNEIVSTTASLDLVFDESKGYGTYYATNRGIRIEKVKSIIPIGRAEVFDLTIADTHNFIAEGLIVHNTRWNEDDLYGHLDKEDFRGKAYRLGIIDELTDQSIWEDKFSTERMHRLRRGNLAAFELQMLCSSGVSLGGIFNDSHFDLYDDLPKSFFKWQAVDLAIGQKARNDYFAHVTIAAEKFTKRIYLIDYNETKIPFARQVELVNSKFRRHADTVRVGIEANAYQIVLVQVIRDSFKDIPVVPRYTVKDKEARAQQLSLLAADHGSFMIRREHDHFKRRMCSFPNGPKDLFDAFDMAIGMALKGVRKRRKKEPGLL
jgi:intein/homing endonuclease